MIEDYIKYLGNQRWSNLGFGNLYDGYEDISSDMAWVNSYANANMVKTDFFEARSTAYSKGSAFDDDL
jgi:ribonucleoside-diphosphate reductase beta chain